MSKLGAFMADIFDEVDDILADVDASVDQAPGSEASDSNFNESELQDIMAEIESLEKDFEAEPAEEEAVIEVEAKKTNLQEEIERELEMSLQSGEVTKEEVQASVVTQTVAETPTPTPTVLAFEKKSQPVPSTVAPEISFEATGAMNLNLGFKIGEETAKLSIDPVKGMMVTMNGVELCINQEIGCTVTMENGVTFTIPLTSTNSTTKKKSA